MKMTRILAALAACALLGAPPAARAADNYTVKDSAGSTITICAKDVAGVKSTCNVIQKADGTTINPSTSDLQTTGNTSLGNIDTNQGATGDSACGSDNGTCSALALIKRTNQRLTSAITALGSPFQAGGALGAGSVIIGKVGIDQSTPGTTDSVTVKTTAGTATTTVTRPADTNGYAANDALSDSTSAPTSGGFTFSSMCSASGKSGIIVSAKVIDSVDPATPLQGEIWLFDSAVTNVNDNAAFALSDSDAVKLVGVIPFALLTTTAGSGTNSWYGVTGLNMGYTCSGSANLRFLVKVKNAYTPPSNSEQLTVRLDFVGTN